MRPIQLPPRLLVLAEQVPMGAKFADIGTDHAYLPVWLLQHGVIERALACDLRAGPLERARATAEKYGLTEAMDFRLCDGLAGVCPEEANVIAVAGMGGETISDILSGAPWTRSKECLLLLQPMSAQPELRQWLQKHDYTILREILSKEGDILYTILLVCGGRMRPLTLAEQWAGQQKPGDDAPLRTEYLNRLIAQADRAIDGLKRSSRPQDVPRMEKWEQIDRELLDLREEWLRWQR